MTALEFRSNSKLRSELQEALEKEAVLQALAIIKSDGDGDDVAEDAPEIASVRRLSGRTRVEKAVQELFALTRPIPKVIAPPTTTFGTEHDADEFDALNPRT